MPVSSSSQSSLLQENSRPLKIEDINKNLENCKRFILINKYKEIAIFWNDSYLDQVSFPDLSADAPKSERELFKELCTNTIESAHRFTDTQAIPQKEKNDLIRYLGDVRNTLNDEKNSNPIQSDDRTKLNDYYVKDIERKLKKYEVYKDSISASVANLFRALQNIHCVLRFLAIKKIVQENVREKCLEGKALRVVEQQVKVSFASRALKKTKLTSGNADKNNNKKIDLEPTLINLGKIADFNGFKTSLTDALTELRDKNKEEIAQEREQQAKEIRQLNEKFCQCQSQLSQIQQQFGEAKVKDNAEKQPFLQSLQERVQENLKSIEEISARLKSENIQLAAKESDLKGLKQQYTDLNSKIEAELSGVLTLSVSTVQALIEGLTPNTLPTVVLNLNNGFSINAEKYELLHKLHANDPFIQKITVNTEGCQNDDNLQRYCIDVENCAVRNRFLTTRQGENEVRSRGARDRRALTGEAGNASRRKVIEGDAGMNP
ncbi:MAG: hypothetical protein WAL30_05890, partial [Candidatus Aquirickettsiella sp.]